MASVSSLIQRQPIEAKCCRCAPPNVNTHREQFSVSLSIRNGMGTSPSAKTPHWGSCGVLANQSKSRLIQARNQKSFTVSIQNSLRKKQSCPRSSQCESYRSDESSHDGQQSSLANHRSRSHDAASERHNPSPTSRRNLLLGLPSAAAALAAAASSLPASAALSAGAAFKHLTSVDGFQLDYPASFITVYDRSGQPEPPERKAGKAILLVGNFSTFDTVRGNAYPHAGKNISTTELLPFPQDEAELSAAAGRNDGLSYEVLTETCRGRVGEEGAGGVRECLSPNGNDLLVPVVRHHVGKVLLLQGECLVIDASCLQDRWAAAGAELLRSVDSFKLWRA